MKMSMFSKLMYMAFAFGGGAAAVAVISFGWEPPNWCVAAAAFTGLSQGAFTDLILSDSR